MGSTKHAEGFSSRTLTRPSRPEGADYDVASGMNPATVLYAMPAGAKWATHFQYKRTRIDWGSIAVQSCMIH